MSDNTDIVVVCPEQDQLVENLKNMFFADVFDALASAAPEFFRRLGVYMHKAAGEIGYDLQERLEARRDQYRQ